MSEQTSSLAGPAGRENPSTAEPDQRRERPGVRTTALAGFTTVVTVLPVYLVGGLAVQLEDHLGMNALVLGLVVAVYWAVSALLSVLAGAFVQRRGVRVGMLLAAGIGLLSLIGIAWGTKNWVALLVWLAVAGIGNAFAQPASNGLIAKQVAVPRRALAFGLKQAAIPAATLVAGAAVPLVAFSLGWQWAFAECAVLATVVLAFLARLVPRYRPARASCSSQGGCERG